MKKYTITALFILTAPLTSFADPGACANCQKGCKGGGAGAGGGCLVETAIPKNAKPAGKISGEQRQELLLLQEEERLAFDIYNKLGEKYPLSPFKNIPRSEANHMEATANLLEYHGIPKPGKTEAGKYQSPTLQKLYDKLVKRGLKSEIKALRVGALVEETDIRDLRLMAKNPPSEVAGNLSKKLELASYNHLRAFVRNLAARGVDYEPVILEKKDFDRIVGGEEVDKPAPIGKGKGKGGGNASGSRQGERHGPRAGRGRGRGRP